MGKKEKSSLVLPYDFEAVFEYLSVEQAGRLIRAIYAYERRDEAPDFSDDALLDITWKTNVKLKVDHNKQRYQEVVEARREAGKKGGRPKEENQMVNKKPNGFSKNQTKAKKPKKAEYDCDCDCEYECDKDIPSNIQTTSNMDIATYPQQPVDNSAPEETENAEPVPDKPKPASLDGKDLYLMESPAAFNLFRSEYPRRQGALRDVQVAWVTAVAGGAAPGDLVMAARKYAAECKTEKTEQKYIAMPQNFLKDKWRTYIPRYSPGCTKCHGSGTYERDNQLYMCDCDRRYG